MNVIFALSLSILASAIFYFFQTYIVSVRIRPIAKRELSTLCSRILGVFEDIFMSSVENEADLEKWSFKSIDDFLSEIVAIQIYNHFDFTQQANYSPKMS